MITRCSKLKIWWHDHRHERVKTLSYDPFQSLPSYLPKEVSFLPSIALEASFLPSLGSFLPLFHWKLLSSLPLKASSLPSLESFLLPFPWKLPSILSLETSFLHPFAWKLPSFPWSLRTLKLSPETNLDNSWLLLGFLGSSDNFKLHVVLPHIPPVLDVYLEVLTFSLLTCLP